jgi:hypothetical protein
MEMDSQTDMKRDKTGITNIVSKEPLAEPRRKRKPWGAGETVGVSIRLKRDDWLALHEAARDERTNVTQLVLGWLDEHRRKKGLPTARS